MMFKFNVKQLFYFIGFLSFSIGLVFYSTVIVSEGILGQISEYMIKRTSTHYMYAGLILITIGLFVTKDLYRFHQWLIHKLPKDMILYLSILFTVALYLVTILTPAVYAHFFIQLVMIVLTIYLTIRVNWKFSLGILVVLLNVIESYVFLFEIDYFFTSFDQSGRIISYFIMLCHLVYILFLIYTYFQRKQKRMDFGVLIWSLLMGISVYLVNPVGYSRIYTFSEMTNQSDSYIKFSDYYLFSNLLLCLLLGTTIYFIFKRKLIPSDLKSIKRVG